MGGDTGRNLIYYVNKDPCVSESKLIFVCYLSWSWWRPGVVAT